MRKMKMGNKTKILLMILITMIFYGLFMPSITKSTEMELMTIEEVRELLPIGISYERAKNVLNERKIKFFFEKKEDLTPLRQKHLPKNIELELVFVIASKTSGTGLNTIEKHSIASVWFGKDMLVNKVSLKQAYSGQ